MSGTVDKMNYWTITIVLGGAAKTHRKTRQGKESSGAPEIRDGTRHPFFIQVKVMIFTLKQMIIAQQTYLMMGH